jgi:hypothetical protein
MASFRWELPLISEELNNTGYIHGNAKPHLFNSETGLSHCKRYEQVPFYAEEIKYDGRDEYFCKKCLKKYKKLQKQLDEQIKC